MLNDNLIKKGLNDKFTIVHSDFLKVHLATDIVLFEF